MRHTIPEFNRVGIAGDCLQKLPIAPLALAQRCFDLFSLAHIRSDRIDAFATVLRHCRPRQPTVSSVSATVAILKLDSWLTLDKLAQFLLRLHLVLGVDELRERTGNQLVRAVTEGSLESGIHSLEIAIAARNAEHLQRELEKIDKLRFNRGLSAKILRGVLCWSGCFHGDATGRRVCSYPTSIRRYDYRLDARQNASPFAEDTSSPLFHR